MNAATPMSAAVAQAAPMIPKAGIAVKVQLSATLAAAANIMLTIGIVVCPSPCNTPVDTW